MVFSFVVALIGNKKQKMGEKKVAYLDNNYQ
jgi:hypothetical protein